jgi:hypothetical protein
MTEYRTDAKGRPIDYQRLRLGQILTYGFATGPLQNFHGEYQIASRFRYFGRQMVEQQMTDVVGFAEIPESQHSSVHRLQAVSCGEPDRPAGGKVKSGNLSLRRYGNECDMGGFGFFREALPAHPTGAETFPRLDCPPFDLRQRESSWQYLASSRAASL